MDQLTNTRRSTASLLLLAASLMLGMLAVAACVLARTFLMNTPADWLTIDYTLAGWALRLGAEAVGMMALMLALLGRRGIQKRRLRTFVYRADVTLALTAIAFEIAVPAILLILIIGLFGDAMSRSVAAHSPGCLGSSLDFFDFFDAED